MNSNGAQQYNITTTRQVLLAADLPPDPSGPDPQDDYLIQELFDEFRRVPDEWKPDVLDQVCTFIRLSTLSTARYIAEDQPNPDPKEPVNDDPTTACEGAMQSPFRVVTCCGQLCRKVL